MTDHLLAIQGAATWLGEYRYVTAILALAFLFSLRRELRRNGDATLPTLLPVCKLLLLPALALLAGTAFTSVDESSETLTKLLMIAVAAVFLVNLIAAPIVFLRYRTNRLLLGTSLLLETWISFCIAGASVMVISGIGRHWL